MWKMHALVLAVASLSCGAQNCPYAASIVSYDPGVGHVWGYTQPEAALGQPGQPDSWGYPADPFSPAWEPGQVVSIGQGGHLTVRLGSPACHHPLHPDGLDFIIFGNSGFIVTNEFDENWNYVGAPATDGTLFGASAGAMRVAVSRDGVRFYDLDPVLAPAVDRLCPTDGAGDCQKPVDRAVAPEDFAGATLADIRALYQGSAGGAAYSLAWARDQGGKPVRIQEARFVRVTVLSDKVEIDGFALVAPQRHTHRIPLRNGDWEWRRVSGAP